MGTAIEVVPKATFRKQKLELSFYERYLASAAMYRGPNRIEQIARVQAAQRGMAAYFTPDCRPPYVVPQNA
jgi:hypothetical protein